MSTNANSESEHFGLPLSRTLKVLMVEDSPADAELAWAVLKRAGYLLIFEVVSDPTRFEERLRTDEFDLVLSDHNLISWTGMDALEILHRTGRDIPFIVVTATLGDEAAVEYLRQGAADYVLKHRLERLPVSIGHTLREHQNRRQKQELQDRVQSAKKEWELTFDMVPDAIFLTDGECNIRRANHSATQVLGLKFSEIIGRACPEVLNGLCKPTPECRHMDVMVAPVIRDQKTSEENLVFEATSTPVRDATGMLKGCVHVVRDVSERSRADAALRESERKYRELVENTPYGVFRSTADGRFLDVNPALVSMLGYSSKEEVLKLNLASDLYRRPSERVTLLQQYRGEISQAHGDLCWMKKDGGTVLLRTAGRVVRDDTGQIQYYEVIAEDITAQRTLEAELRQAQKMEAVGRLAGGVAHDFNNLLAVILGNVDLILDPSAPQDKLTYRVEEIRTATVRAAELTQRLLTFSRKQPLEERVFDMNDVVKETSKLLRRVLGEDIDLVLRVSSSPQRIRTDQAQLEQALMNLAVNARDAMKDGGSLIIETSDVKLDSSYVGQGRTIAPGDYVQLMFSDTGIGMDEKIRNRIFEPFFTTKEPGKGTGLGLSMVYGFVQQSRGLIHVYSEVGKGTTFKLYFPKIRAREEAAAVPSGGAIVGGSETILLVEDEESLREIVKGILQSLGYRVLSAASGPQAIEILHQYSDRVDLLLTDMIMPGMNGRELSEQVTTLRPSVQVIYMSGYVADVILKHVPQVSVDRLLHKPFTRTEVARRIREVLDHDRRAPEERVELQEASA